MPVIPSFKSFAQTPNLAGAYTGGIAAGQAGERLGLEGERLGLEREGLNLESARIAQQASQASNQLAMQGQRIAAEERMATMENASRTEQLQNDMLREQTRMGIEKAYKDSQIGLQKDRLAQQGKALELDVAASAQQLQDQTKYLDLMQEGEAAGMTKEEASRAAILQIPSAAFRVAGRGGAEGPMDLDTVAQPITTPEGDILGYGAQVGARSRQFIDKPESGDPDLMHKGLMGQVKGKERRLERLEQEHAADSSGRNSLQKIGTKEEKPRDTQRAIAYQERAEKIDDLENEIEDMYQGITSDAQSAPRGGGNYEIEEILEE